MDMSPTRATRDGAAARRRLLRGVFSAAAVVPLSSGAQVAASSSLRCFANSPDALDNPPANLFLVQRYSVTISGTTTRFVRKADILSLGSINGFDALTYVNAAPRDGANYIKPNGDPFTFDDVANPPQPNANEFVALRFQNFGAGSTVNMKVTGLARSSTNKSGTGKVLYKSCWSSFKP